MKRKFTFLAAALALFAFLAIPLGMRGQTRAEVVAYTLDGTEVVGTNSAPYNSYAAASPVTQDGISWEVYANTNMSPWRIGGKSITNVDRPVYSTDPISDNITKIEVTHGTANNITVNSWTVIVASDADFNNVVSTLTPTFAANATTTINRPEGADWTGCYFKFVYNVSVSGNSNRFVQFTKAEFYKQEGSGPVIATPTFSPAAGTYTEAQSVSISCETQGTTIYYTTDGSDPDDESTEYTGSITVSETTTIKAIAIDGDDNTSSIATATYNILTPMTIAEVRAQGTGSVFTSGTVTSCVGTTGYIQDATAAICVYGTALTVGDNITVQGTLSDYNGLLEITNPVVTVVSSGNTVNPELMTIAQVNASTNQGWYVRIEGATVTAINDKNATIAQGENSVVVRFANASDITFAVDDIISLNGNIGYYNANQIANPQNVTVQENENPTISAENVSIAANAIEGEISYTINNPVTGGVLTAATTADWLTLDDDFTSPIAFDCSANTASTARTATVTLTYTYNTNQTVTKDVTVTQAGFEATSFTWDLSTTSYDEALLTDEFIQWSSAYATMTNEKNTSSQNVTNYIPPTRTSTRFYSGQRLTITPASGYAITSVVFTSTSENYANAFVSSTWTNATASASGTTVTVTPTTGTNAIQAIIGGTCGFTGVTVYYVEDNTPTITTNNVELVYDATSGEIAYTLNNPVQGGTMSASTTADWITLGNNFESPIAFTCTANEAGTARTATVTLTYTYNRETVTKDVTITQAANPNYVMTIAEVRAQGTGDVITEGIVTSCVGTTGYIQDATAAICVYGAELTVGDEIRVSGTLTTFNGLLEIASPEVTVLSSGNTVNPELMTIAEINASTNQGWYVRIENATVSAINDKNVTIAQNEDNVVVRFANTGDITFEVNDVISLNGNIGAYNGVQIANPQNVEVQQNTEPTVTITDDTVNVPAEGGNGTITVTYENIEVGDIDPEVLFFAADGTTSATYDWITVTFNEENNAVYTVEANDGEARTAYFKVNEQSYSVLSNLVTVNQAAYVAPPTPGNWVLTTLADLTADDIFVIVGTRTDETYAGDYAMTNDNGTSAPSAVSVTVVDGTLAAEPADNLKWNLEITDDGYVFYPNGDTENWLYCINTNNGVKVGTGEAKHYTLSENGYLTTTETTIQRYLGVYLAQDWRCYNTEGGNIANQTFAFYKRVDAAGTPLFISGYNGSAFANGGYHLIATPVDGIDPANVTNMTNGNYDLYMFDQSGDDEWVNYRQGNNQFAFTELVAGMGYLYAHDTDITLYFEGDLIEGDSYDVSLVLDTDSEFPGWNLVGNSFTVPASIGDRDYYEMHENGRDLIQTSGAIDPMQGIFVIAETDEEELTFSKTIATGGSKVVMNVASDRSSLVDRATIRFGEGRQLRKIQLNPDNTKIYITEGNTDYAVVRSSDEAEIPVSFKTAENGTYTINFSTEEVEMEYMHLIDNMTGADVDLLATPSYTFEARTTDYASRFRLVFATTTGVSENSENNFAFYNGGNWVINNMGDATLQVVDMLGHILSSETINGNASISIDQVPGVYMIRLVSGNDVKVQKVIIK